MHLVGFIIRIYHDARSPERQITRMSLGAEEGQITGSYISGSEAYGSIKCRYYFDKLVDFQNHMGALSPKELDR